jgi:hypothetical protein
MSKLTGNPPIRKPIIGEKIYVPSAYHVYRGKNDFEGGLATIDSIEYSKFLPEDHINYIMVGVKERKGVMSNWRMLLEKQKQLKKEYKDKIAHADPDLRPQFNDDNEGWKTVI